MISLPVPARRRPASGPPTAAVQSPLARAAAAQHPVAGARTPRRPGRQAPALRLTRRGRAVVAVLLGFALWGAASAAWLATRWILTVAGA
ncbi:hypothetical protein [Frankia nepalensis]|uniref:hypothetical protein n=1 Tax=Frankia nepalensis TaxID=1836974 RepID=UPI0027DE05FB|nr:hypothetical protein [Frankia nepalensis]